MIWSLLRKIFRCDSSSINHNVGLLVGWSVRNEFYSSVMLLVVYVCCYSYCNYAFFSCDRRSIGHNVCLSVCIVRNRDRPLHQLADTDISVSVSIISVSVLIEISLSVFNGIGYKKISVSALVIG